VGLSARVDLKSRYNDRQVRLDDRHDREEDRRPHGMVRLPTGQFVTPTALEDSSQQYLNPGLVVNNRVLWTGLKGDLPYRGPVWRGFTAKAR
jgi:hypothetical protein